MDFNTVAYIDQYTSEMQKNAVSLKNFYDTILITDTDREHIFRIAIDDFFIKYRTELSEIIEFRACSDRHFYKPKTFSYDLYGTTDLWLSLLRLNNMRNVTEFCEYIIKIYNPIAIREIIKIFFKREHKKT